MVDEVALRLSLVIIIKLMLRIDSRIHSFVTDGILSYQLTALSHALSP